MALPLVVCSWFWLAGSTGKYDQVYRAWRGSQTLEPKQRLPIKETPRINQGLRKSPDVNVRVHEPLVLRSLGEYNEDWSTALG